MSTRSHIVTLNATDRVDPDQVLARMTYEHPIYTAASLEAQRHLAELNDASLAFAGAYQGWGFHEDGCRSGIDGGCIAGGELVTSVAPFDRPQSPPPLVDQLPALYAAEVTHTRRAPITNSFRYRASYWLVDYDRVTCSPGGIHAPSPASSAVITAMFGPSWPSTAWWRIGF